MTDHRIHTEADLDRGIAALVAADPRFAALIAKAGRPPLRRRSDGFAGLASTVVSQQLSTASAGAIWGRLAAAFDPVEPAAIIRARKERLARIGLSAPKIRALKEIARAVVRGDLALATLGDIDADAAHARTHRRSRHRAVDRRHLSARLPRPCRCLAGRRPGAAGSRTSCVWAQGTADDERDDAARRTMAAVARCGGARAMDLLSRGQRPRRRAGPAEKIRQAERKEEWPLSSTVRGLSRNPEPRNSSSCSCTAMAPTATTSSRSAAPGSNICRTPPSSRRTRRSRAVRRRSAGNGFR